MKAEELMGRVVAGFGGFYHVRLSDGRVLVCRGRGKLKKTHKSILVGDDVRISMLDGEGVLLGNSDQKVEAMIEEIYPRRNQLHRPHICNIDQLVIVLAWHLPDYDLLLLDNMLLMARMAQVDVLICFNKTDLMLPEEQPQLELIRRAYGEAGCKVLTVSAELGRGVEELRHELSGRCSVFAGPSGVGKSSLLNLLLPDEHAQTGAVSERLLRGKHTTRYVRLLPLPDDEANSMIADTPGFFVLDSPSQVDQYMLPQLYSEYVLSAESDNGCRFDGCRHDKEPDCAVREAVEQGMLDSGRYQRYLRILHEIQEREAKFK